MPSNYYIITIIILLQKLLNTINNLYNNLNVFLTYNNGYTIK